MHQARDKTAVARTQGTSYSAPVLLVIAATQQELAGATGAKTLVCGMGPHAAYSAAEDAVAEGGATAVLHVGIAGARRGSGVPLLATVIGTEAIDCDGDSEPIAPDRRLFAAVRRVLPDALALPIGTSAHVGGTSGPAVEAMEGHSVLSACMDEGVPALELRVISNEIEEADRALWRFDDAFAELARVTALVIPELNALLTEIGRT
jgi:nucleoside phosphorylase